MNINDDNISIIGEFEAPLIPNPECESAPGCGEWEAPMINNPEYKGKWKPKMIANPEYKGMVDNIHIFPLYHMNYNLYDTEIILVQCIENQKRKMGTKKYSKS